MNSNKILDVQLTTQEANVLLRALASANDADRREAFESYSSLIDPHSEQQFEISTRTWIAERVHRLLAENAATREETS